MSRRPDDKQRPARVTRGRWHNQYTRPADSAEKRRLALASALSQIAAAQSEQARARLIAKLPAATREQIAGLRTPEEFRHLARTLSAI